MVMPTAEVHQAERPYMPPEIESSLVGQLSAAAQAALPYIMAEIPYIGTVEHVLSKKVTNPVHIHDSPSVLEQSLQGMSIFTSYGDISRGEIVSTVVLGASGYTTFVASLADELSCIAAQGPSAMGDGRLYGLNKHLEAVRALR